jgi:hypothetical protein
MAQEKPGQTLQATALVHEAYIRLVDVDKALHWNSRGHFFGAAAEAMRRILLDRARHKNRQKRGGHLRKMGLDKIAIAISTCGDNRKQNHPVPTNPHKHQKPQTLAGSRLLMSG